MKSFSFRELSPLSLQYNAMNNKLHKEGRRELPGQRYPFQVKSEKGMRDPGVWCSLFYPVFLFDSPHRVGTTE